MIQMRLNYRFCVCLLSLLCATVIILFMLNFPLCLNKNMIYNELSKNALNYVNFKEQKYQERNKLQLIGLINKHNKEEKILNSDKFGPVSNDSIILVIQVHKMSESFKYLLASLSELTGIQKALLIFSHSYYDDNVNKLIESIDFCLVLQIYYTHSTQIFTNEFPGYSSHDCPHDMKIKRAKFLNCTGAYTPDIHGRYRQPFKSEKKHHWWWTANNVFDVLNCTQRYNGVVVFLEDDLYLIEDFFYMVINMRRIAESLPQCDFLSLGASITGENLYRVDFTTWDPRFHSSALAFDVDVWNKILDHYNFFCDIDDSSWSRSLLYLSLNQIDNKRFKVLHSTFPRAMKISPVCRVFSRCDAVADNVIKIMSTVKLLKNNLYPPFIEMYSNIELEDDEYIIFDLIDGEGGWKDPRDISLCKIIINF